MVHLLSWHQIQSEEELAGALRQVKEAGLIEEEAVQLWVVGDGARWIWKVVKGVFSSAREVLDYYHCAGRLHAVAALQWGAGEEAAEWVEACLARLFAGEISEVVQGLKQMEGGSEEAQKAMAGLCGDLEANQQRVDYGGYRRGVILWGVGG